MPSLIQVRQRTHRLQNDDILLRGSEAEVPGGAGHVCPVLHRPPDGQVSHDEREAGCRLRVPNGSPLRLQQKAAAAGLRGCQAKPPLGKVHVGQPGVSQ